MLATAGLESPIPSMPSPAAAESVNVTLGAATDTSFIVLDPDGRPLAGASVEPNSIRAPNNCCLGPPRAMQQAIRSTTDSTGRAMLSAIAWEGFASVKITAASVGSQAICLLDRGGIQRPHATRRAQIGDEVGPSGDPAAAGGPRRRPDRGCQAGMDARVKIYLSTTDAPGFEGGLAEVTTGDDGRFVVPAIAEGKLGVTPHIDPSLSVRPRPISDVWSRAIKRRSS